MDLSIVSLVPGGLPVCIAAAAILAGGIFGLVRWVRHAAGPGISSGDRGKG
jgi:hypothetical protein